MQAWPNVVNFQRVCLGHIDNNIFTNAFSAYIWPLFQENVWYFSKHFGNVLLCAFNMQTMLKCASYAMTHSVTKGNLVTIANIIANLSKSCL